MVLMAKTKIEWADFSINCITGCTRVSVGCANCYAILQSFRCSKMGIDKYDGVTEKKNKVLDWTGKIRMFPKVLDEPGKRKIPTRYFGNSMSDTFHKDVPFDFIDRIIQMCLNNPCHEFMILTKRPENIIKYLDSGHTRVEMLDQCKNLILMTSVENQEVADKRVPSLLSIRDLIPGFPIGLSCEPLLGPINLIRGQISWCIVGGESGHRARPMHPQWVRDIKDQCLGRNVPFFFKQWGEWLPSFQENNLKPEEVRDNRLKWLRLDYDGNSSESLDDPMRVSDDELFFYRVTKKKAGRVLDGRTWDELPELKRDK